MMYVQENEETMPGTDFWSVVDGASGKILVCPTAGKKIANAYGYSNRVAGIGLGEIQMPTEEELTMDAVDGLAGNLLLTLEDVDFRHTGKVIVSYVDGHVAFTNSVRALYAKPEDAFAATTSLTMPEKPTATTDTAVSSDGKLSVSFPSGDVVNYLNYVKYDSDMLTVFSSMYGRSVQADYKLEEEVTTGWEVSFTGLLNGYQGGKGNMAPVFAVLDDTGKTILTFTISLISWSEYKVELNGKKLLSSTNNTSSDWKKVYDASITEANFSLVATANGCYASFGNISGQAGFADATANWKKPTTLRFISMSYDDGNGTCQATYKNIQFAGI